MKEVQVVKEPQRCSRAELEAFERLVRVGFDGSDDTLSHRIRAAHRVAFRLEPEHGVVAIAGLKRPTMEYRESAFSLAASGLDPARWRLELGWVFVRPSHRGAGIARALCDGLLQEVDPNPVFATTHPDNASMIRVLGSLGFEWVGRPFQRRAQELLVFARPRPHCPAGG